MDAKQSALARLTEDGWMARSTTKKGFGIIGVGLHSSVFSEHIQSSCWLYSRDFTLLTESTDTLYAPRVSRGPIWRSLV